MQADPVAPVPVPPLSWRHARDPEALLACGFGSGFVKPAPGTWGSVVGLVIWWFALAPLTVVQQLLIIIAVLLLGAWIAGRVASRYAQPDAPQIVIDEFVGLWITLLGFGPDPLWALAGFGLFRLFDITKPGVVRWADRTLKGGFGIMADDALAGCLAALVLQLAFWLTLLI